MASRWVMLTPGVPYIRVVDPVGYSIKLDHQPMDLRAEGGPRWDTLDIPHGKEALEYRGNTLHQMDLDLLFDSVLDARPDVEKELAAIHLLTQPRRDKKPGTPVVRLTFGVGQQLLWVARGPIEWKEIVRSPRTGRRVQARLVLPLIEYRKPELLMAEASGAGK